MIAAIREFLKTCPLISKNGIINVNYLEGAKVKYTLDNVPCIPEVKRYSDGGSLRQFIFIFASREDYDANIVNNENVAKFFEDMQNWIEEQNDRGNLPKLSGNDTATRIEVQSSAYLIGSDAKTARFQMQLKLTYVREKTFY